MPQDPRVIGVEGNVAKAIKDATPAYQLPASCSVTLTAADGTANDFEPLTFDIADVDVGKNIGADLQTDQAEADKKIAQAKAEERRAMAVALEQEMVAKAQEARAKVIEAEVEIPLAMADSLRKGNLGIMDYYKFQNIQADTDMRESISKSTGKDKK